MGRTCRLANCGGKRTHGSAVGVRERNKTAPAEPFGVPPACLFAVGCKPNSVFQATISLGRLLPTGSSSLPAEVPAFAGVPCGRGSFAYLALLPVGFALPSESPRTRCALTAPFHPYRKKPLSGCLPAVSFLLHFPSDCSALMLSSTRPVRAV